MTAPMTDLVQRPRRGLALAAAATALLLAAAPGTAEAKVLGAAKAGPASCPENCLVEAKVTGFHTWIGRQKNPFRVPAHGKIVAWSIKLGSPAPEDRRFFTSRFGAPQARISILKPLKIRKGRRTKVKYKLLRQSPVQMLQPFFGTTTTFGLSQRLKVRKGNIVALTLPTWAPAFAVGQSAKWRASRVPTKARGPCTSKQGFANVEAGDAHTVKGSQRKYGCVYKGARLLYTARFIRTGSGGR